jgi:hypothetical protein
MLRIMKKLGPEGSARLIETLYDLIVVKKMTSQALKKLEEGVGRPRLWDMALCINPVQESHDPRFGILLEFQLHLLA